MSTFLWRTLTTVARVVQCQSLFFRETCRNARHTHGQATQIDGVEWKRLRRFRHRRLRKNRGDYLFVVFFLLERQETLDDTVQFIVATVNLLHPILF